MPGSHHWMPHHALCLIRKRGSEVATAAFTLHFRRGLVGHPNGFSIRQSCCTVSPDFQPRFQVDGPLESLLQRHTRPRDQTYRLPTADPSLTREAIAYRTLEATYLRTRLSEWNC